MSIDDLTVSQCRDIAAMFGGQAQANIAGPWRVGEKYLIRTVTNYLTGRLVSVGHQELLLSDAAWIADTGRFSEAIRTGVLNEVEPIGTPVIVGRGAVVDAEVWAFDLPTEVK